MMAQEIVTSIQEKVKLTIVLLDNSGYGSIGGLSESLGSERFGTRYLYRDETSGALSGDGLPVDLATNAESLGAHVIRCGGIESVKAALEEAKKQTRTTVIYVPTDLFQGVEGYSWWEVPVAEATTMDSVSQASKSYEENKKKQRYYL